jgi:hypothetical protein
MPDESPADLFQPVGTAHDLSNDGPEPGQAVAMRPWSKQIIGLAVATLGVVGATVAYALIAPPSDRAEVADQSSAPQPPAAATALPAPPPPLPAPADTADALIDPPGQTRSGGGTFDLAMLKTNNLLPPAIQDALQAGGMTDGVFKTTTVGDSTIGLFALTLPDQQAATTAALAITTAQLDGGLKADDKRALQGVAVMGSVPGSDSTAYRAIYVLYNRAILVEISGSNRDAVLNLFDAVVHMQVNHAPPTVRVQR